MNADLFSVGSIFFSLLTGKRLFSNGNGNNILETNKLCDLTQSMSAINKLSEEPRDLLMRLITADPDFRPSAR